jgi:hypothetical protein
MGGKKPREIFCPRRHTFASALLTGGQADQLGQADATLRLMVAGS